jgi:hypothetical protein
MTSPPNKTDPNRLNSMLFKKQDQPFIASIACNQMQSAKFSTLYCDLPIILATDLRSSSFTLWQLKKIESTDYETSPALILAD